jgi:cytochrome c-type biogenesis protein CcmF
MEKTGYIILVLALIASIYAVIANIIASRKKSTSLLKSAQYSLITTAVLISISVLILVYAIFSHNFALEYVSSYTSLNTSPLYLITALWAGNSGSLLFWAWLLSIFSLIAILSLRGKARVFRPWTGAVLMATETLFLILLVGVTNPFTQNSVIPADGMGLNPMLQNLGMVFHPPALLIGYVVFTIPFAIAISSLILGKTSDEWLLASRKWILAAWLMLGIGNIIGMWWAYVELGWGGYWAWDAVENAGLMPWLVATALLHSSIMQRRKGIFKVWNIVLIILTFCLVMFGTFLTRSGILSSVHTFGDSGMDPYFIIFISLAFFGAFGLLFYRWKDLKSGGNESLISKESSFILNNILLVGTTFVILIGTVFPAITEAIGGAKMSLNASFFNKVNGPLFLAIIVLAGICAIIGWKKATLKQLLKKILWPLIISVAVSVILAIIWVREPAALIAFFVCVFVFTSIVSEFVREGRARQKAPGGSRLTTWLTLIGSNSQRYGGYIVHLGIVLMAIGIIGSSFYGVEKAGTLKIGESLNINQYSVAFDGLDVMDTPDKYIVTANLSVYRSGLLIDHIVSEKYFQKSQNQPVTEVGIRSNLIEDLYVILEGWNDDGSSADFKIMVNPMVFWIWIGGGVFLAGGLITFWPPRRKNPIDLDEEERDETKKLKPEPKTNTSLEESLEADILNMRKTKGMVCPKCGSKNQADAKFCRQCAATLPRKKE